MGGCLLYLPFPTYLGEGAVDDNSYSFKNQLGESHSENSPSHLVGPWPPALLLGYSRCYIKRGSLGSLSLVQGSELPALGL